MAHLKTIVNFLLLLLVLFATASHSFPHEEAAEDDYDYSDEEEETCDKNNCKLPNCSCFGGQPKIPVNYRPQFVMLTFDDAITVANIDTYRKIISGRKHVNGRGISMTFFVCHEYNDYTLANELYSQGHEIAVHSISHVANTELWRDADDEKWKREMVGARTMLKTFGGIPAEEVTGHRAPFLQTAGNITFRTLKNEGFLYDSSLPTRNYMEPPIWPYTLDHGFSQDCQIEPCPSGSYEGLWIVPMIQYKLTSKDGDFFCSMADACTPQPDTAATTKDYLMKNFLRHFNSNRAPFPVFLHEGWLRKEERLDGYLQFLDEILQKPEVFLVTVRDVLDYMQKPVHFPQFVPRSWKQAAACKNTEICSYKTPLRIMKSCAPCPKYYPWVGTPLGKKPPKGFPTWE